MTDKYNRTWVKINGTYILIKNNDTKLTKINN